MERVKNFKVLIRADASTGMGSGHVMRCLNLADRLRQKGAAITFASREYVGNLHGVVKQRGYPIVSLPARRKISSTSLVTEDAHETIQLAEKNAPYDLVIVDHYALDSRWERLVRRIAQRVMVIDDVAQRRHDCDLLLDSAFYKDPIQRYKGLLPKRCKTFFGPEYVLLATQFCEQRERPLQKNSPPQRLLLSFGGSDPTGETVKVLTVFGMLSLPGVVIDVVAGRANPHHSILNAQCQRLKNAIFYPHVDNMAERMAQCDLAIGAGGSTVWERCSLSVPTITVAIAENQVELLKGLQQLGVIHHLGWHQDVSRKQWLNEMKKVLTDSQIHRKLVKNCEAFAPRVCTEKLDEMIELMMREV
ncbi:UDP-2,4-diacetamido-2,4,6-trideoxy-beta-L-altropyranose hydrolase [Marininema halotolerans]|uniref:UDP-2,4-diacetamido-2,4,6-trideoxy-beta-L-altropyranose hydrolase n=1 Tax=Marininema halotolerans TaxID=1155944 RepID=A0A1I6NUZ7_9BACL|nr:UDP-2,4-diacetamido-2,4,6-trideoxy-beta-L-altropyranose hydrolase [Marininema halotolerans]SFS31782.1 UDP-2,4-diacetamido-2,4,6-trideoxy-beta-L-altropyranose hydrolase [Marininema halotolerans]